MNEWMNEWINERMNEWISEWLRVNQWVSEWMNKQFLETWALETCSGITPILRCNKNNASADDHYHSCVGVI